jgi:hypothetical protein
MNPTPQLTCGSMREETIMETIDKTTNSVYESFDRIASSTNQAAETLGEKDVHLKHAEQHLMNNFRNYVSYNPWVSQ